MNDHTPFTAIGAALASLPGPIGDALRAAGSVGDRPPPRREHSLNPAGLIALRAAQSAARQARWETGMGGWAEFRGASLADFPARWADPARAWLAGPAQMLALRGSVGSGKTRLAVALGRAALADGLTVAGASAGGLLDALHPGGDAEQVARWDAELLILDDLGSASIKEYGLGRLLQVIDARRTSGARIIRTTNLAEKDEPTEAGRLFSRLAGTTIELIGPDFRRRAAR